MTHKYLLLLFAIIFSHLSVQATHIAGADMQVKYLSGSKYELTLRLYRDCRGLKLKPLDLVVSCLDNATTKTLSLNNAQHKIKDVTQVCDTVAGVCDPINTITSIEGFEEHVFIQELDFGNGGNLSGFSNCCKVKLSLTHCCRNGSINTGISGNFYTEMWFDKCVEPQNNTPVFEDVPIIYVCCNDPSNISSGAYDSDGDSLSFALVAPLHAAGSALSFSKGYSKDQPLDVYYPAGQQGVSNPYAKPPWGVNLNPLNGNLLFTPINCNNVSVLVVEIKEWKKDSAGNMINISETRRDMQVVVKDCQLNNTPQFAHDTDYFVVPYGDSLCFTTTVTNEAVKLSDTPAVYRYDTVSVTWTTSLPNASVSVVDPNAREKEVKVCWNSSSIDSAGGMFYFSVFAENDACPIKGRNNQTFGVFVKGKSILSIEPGLIRPIQKVFIPNAFTPNNSGPQENNVFGVNIPGATNFKMEIFDRLGGLVFHTESIAESWDGYFKNRPCQQGIYSYKISYIDVFGDPQIINGVVQLIR